MKNLFLFLLLLPSLVMAKDIPASPGGVQNAINGAVTGDRVILSADTYTDKFSLKPGVSLIGQGVGKTKISHSGFNGYSGSITANFDQTTDLKGLEIANITFFGNYGQAWSAFRFTNAANFKIHDCELTDYFQSAIELVGGRNANQGCKNIELYNLVIKESSNETTAGCLGNILLYGYHTDVTLRNSTIEHLTNYAKGTADKGQYGQKSSGYAFKAMPNHEGRTDIGGKLLRVRILNNVFKGKLSAPWNNYGSPNINVEFWNVQTQDCEVAGNEFNAALSLEKENEPIPSVSVNVHDNVFKPYTGISATIELALSNAIVRNNEFHYQNHSSVWAIMGEFNNNTNTAVLKGQIIESNKFFLGTSTTIARYNSGLSNWTFRNNQISGPKQTVVSWKGDFVAQSTGITVTGNSFASGYNLFGYQDGANKVPLRVTVTDGAVTTPPVTTPPVVVTPEPEKPTPTTPTTPTVPTNPAPVTSTPAGVMAIVSPLDQSTVDLGKTGSLDLIVIPKAPVLTLKVLRFDTRSEVFAEVIKNAPDTVKRSVAADKLKATSRYLIEFKTTKTDGTLIKQVYYTVYTKAATVTPPVVTPPVVVPPAPTVVQKPVSVSLSTMSNETLGAPVITKDSVNRKYVITVPYNR